jgi:hypothetical protein
VNRARVPIMPESCILPAMAGFSGGAGNSLGLSRSVAGGGGIAPPSVPIICGGGGGTRTVEGLLLLCASLVCVETVVDLTEVAVDPVGNGLKPLMAANGLVRPAPVLADSVACPRVVAGNC